MTENNEQWTSRGPGLSARERESDRKPRPGQGAAQRQGAQGQGSAKGQGRGRVRCSLRSFRRTWRTRSSANRALAESGRQRFTSRGFVSLCVSKYQTHIKKSSSTTLARARTATATTAHQSRRSPSPARDRADAPADLRPPLAHLAPASPTPSPAPRLARSSRRCRTGLTRQRTARKSGARKSESASPELLLSLRLCPLGLTAPLLVQADHAPRQHATRKYTRKLKQASLSERLQAGRAAWLGAGGRVLPRAEAQLGPGPPVGRGRPPKRTIRALMILCPRRCRQRRAKCDGQ